MTVMTMDKILTVMSIASLVVIVVAFVIAVFTKNKTERMFWRDIAIYSFQLQIGILVIHFVYALVSGNL